MLPSQFSFANRHAACTEMFWKGKLARTLVQQAHQATKSAQQMHSSPGFSPIRDPIVFGRTASLEGFHPFFFLNSFSNNWRRTCRMCLRPGTRQPSMSIVSFPLPQPMRSHGPYSTRSSYMELYKVARRNFGPQNWKMSKPSGFCEVRSKAGGQGDAMLQWCGTHWKA